MTNGVYTDSLPYCECNTHGCEQDGMPGLLPVEGWAVAGGGSEFLAIRRACFNRHLHEVVEDHGDWLAVRPRPEPGRGGARRAGVLSGGATPTVPPRERRPARAASPKAKKKTGAR